MVFLLILGGLFLLFLTIKTVGRDYANPAFIYLAIWMIASIFTAFYSSKWGEGLSLITVTVIFVGNTIFLMGVLLSSNLFAEKKLDAKPSGRYVGAAWLSSARAVRCRLKCHNERNPFHQ